MPVKDAAWYESQYRNRLAVPDHPRIFARWEAASAEARRTPGFRADVRYGPHAMQTLDLYPAQGACRAALLFLHGGYWMALDKREHGFAAADRPGGDESSDPTHVFSVSEETCAGTSESRRALFGMLLAFARRSLQPLLDPESSGAAGSSGRDKWGSFPVCGRTPSARSRRFVRQIHPPISNGALKCRFRFPA